MLVSLITPVYNQRKYLSRCVMSIIHQKFQNWELILIDDGSTDGSGALCDEWEAKDGRIHVIHQENAGASAARNRGIRKAHGQYICCIDADDLISPTYLEDLARLIEHKSPDVVLVNVKKLVKNGEGRLFSWIFNEQEDSLRLKKIALGGYVGETWRKIWRKDLIQGDLFPSHLRSMEDLYATADLMQNAESISVLPHAFYMVNRVPHPSLLSSSKDMDKNYNKLLAWKHFVEIGYKAHWEQLHSEIPKFHHLQCQIFGLKTWKWIQKEQNYPAYADEIRNFLQNEGLSIEAIGKINTCLARDTLYSISYILDFIGELPSAWVSRHFKNLMKVYAMDCKSHFLTLEEQTLLQRAVKNLMKQKNAHLVFAHRLQGNMIRHGIEYPFKSKGEKWLNCSDDFIY